MAKRTTHDPDTIFEHLGIDPTPRADDTVFDALHDDTIEQQPTGVALDDGQCDRCDGTGQSQANEGQLCDKCGGTGRLDDQVATLECVYCMCTEDDACETDDGPCSWISKDPPVCSAPACVAQQKAKELEDFARRGMNAQRAVDALLPDPAPGRLPIGVAANLPGTPEIWELVVELPIDDIERDPEQPRTDVDVDLTDSIAEQGVLQPVVVTRLLVAAAGAPMYRLVDGERRWKAANSAGLETIPARVVEFSEASDRLLHQVTFNEGKRLTAMEEANAWARIMKAKGWKIQQLATALGRPKSTVSDRLALLDAPALFQPLFATGVLTPAAAPVIRKYADVPERILKEHVKDLIKHQWRDFVATETPVPLAIAERELASIKWSNALREIQKDSGKGYTGPTCTIDGKKYATDVVAYETADSAYWAAKRGEHSTSPSVIAAQEAERKRVAADRKKQQLKTATRRAQFAAIATKLPGSIGGSVNGADWSELLVHLVMQEVHQDTLRVLAGQLGLTTSKSRTAGMGQYGETIKQHAKTLDARARVQLAFQLLLAPDLAIPSYIARGPERLTAAAKLLKLDLSKIKPAADEDTVKSPAKRAGKPSAKKSRR